MSCCLLALYSGGLKAGRPSNKLDRRNDLNTCCVSVLYSSVKDVCGNEGSEVFRDVIGLQAHAHGVTLPRKGSGCEVNRIGCCQGSAIVCVRVDLGNEAGSDDWSTVDGADCALHDRVACIRGVKRECEAVDRHEIGPHRLRVQEPDRIIEVDVHGLKVRDKNTVIRARAFPRMTIQVLRVLPILMPKAGVRLSK